MGFGENSRRICTSLYEHGGQSVRRLAYQTGLSKSSAHRRTQALERRNCYPASWFWATADGRQWLTRLDTMSEFCTRLHLATQGGCAPSALRGVRQTLEAVRLETTGTWEQEGWTSGEVREVIAAVDETFLARLLLVCMDLATGSLLLEEVADDRPSPTWKAGGESGSKAWAPGCCLWLGTAPRP
jgi:DNA-binding MarR family transcriptional regulator